MEISSCEYYSIKYKTIIIMLAHALFLQNLMHFGDHSSSFSDQNTTADQQQEQQEHNGSQQHSQDGC
jgi:Ca2+/H+ antiporter